MPPNRAIPENCELDEPERRSSLGELPGVSPGVSLGVPRRRIQDGVDVLATCSCSLKLRVPYVAVGQVESVELSLAEI